MSTAPRLTAPDGHAILNAPTPQAMGALARRYRAADNVAMQIIGAVGGSAENAFALLPAAARQPVERATMRVLETCFDVGAHRRMPKLPNNAQTALASVMGALGGMGGLATAVAELPFSTALIMRAIQDTAVIYGFDPTDDETRKDCLQIFATAGPLEDDDGIDLGFVTARVTLTGMTLNAMMARLAPRISALLGQRLAARAVPVLGAAAGAVTNFAFIRYYTEMSHVYFGLRRMAEDSGKDLPLLTQELRDILKA